MRARLHSRELPSELTPPSRCHTLGRRALSALCALSVCCAPPLFLSSSAQAVAEPLPQRLEEAYQEVYTAAESSVSAGRLVEGIRIYEGALTELESYGKVHLRLAQLYLKRGEEAWGAHAAYHYLKCSQDQRLNVLMREQLCEREVRERFVPLLTTGTPARLEVIEPSVFAGVITTKAMLPKGRAVLSLWRSAGAAPEQLTLTLPQREPVALGPLSFMPKRPTLSGSTLLGGAGAPNTTLSSAAASDTGSGGEGGLTLALGDTAKPPRELLASTSSPTLNADLLAKPDDLTRPKLPSWPAYLMFAVSATSAGLAFYYRDNTSTVLAESLPLVFWGASATFAVLGGGWLAIAW